VAHLNQLEGTLLHQLEGFRTLLTNTNTEAGGEPVSWKAHFKPKTLKWESMEEDQTSQDKTVTTLS
jgi:hypothetical protein